MEKQIIVFALLAIVLLNAMTGISGIPIQDDRFSDEDIEEAFRMMSDLPMKRGMCRPGYTYQPITRICVPSLGALRGRGRPQGRRY